MLETNKTFISSFSYKLGTKVYFPRFHPIWLTILLILFLFLCSKAPHLVIKVGFHLFQLSSFLIIPNFFFFIAFFNSILFYSPFCILSTIYYFSTILLFYPQFLFFSVNFPLVPFLYLSLFCNITSILFSQNSHFYYNSFSNSTNFRSFCYGIITKLLHFGNTCYIIVTSSLQKTIVYNLWKLWITLWTSVNRHLFLWITFENYLLFFMVTYYSYS